MFKTPIRRGRTALVFGLVVLLAGCTSARQQLDSGVRLERKGDVQAALKAYARAVEMDPRNALAYFNRACAEKKLGDADAAVKDFSRALELQPDLAAAAMARAQILYSHGDYAGAVADFTRTIELQPDYGDAYLARGIVYRVTGEEEMALADFNKAVAIDPSSAQAFMTRGNLKAQGGDYRGALEDYSRALRLDPDSAAAHYNAGIAREESGDFRGAMAEFEKAAGLSPGVAARARARMDSCAQRLSQAGAPEAPSVVPAVKEIADPFPDWEAPAPDDGAAGKEAVSRVLAQAGRVRGLSSLVIVRNGRLIAEAYFDGHGRHQLRPVRSATKGVLSLLLGIALRDGALRSLDQPVTDFIKTAPGQDPEGWAGATLRGLVDFGAGLDWIKKIEWYHQGNAAGQSELQMSSEELANIDLENIPDTEVYMDVVLFNMLRFDQLRRMVYFASNTGAANVLAEALAKAGGMSVLEFADRELFEPLGIVKRRWGKSGPGTAHGSAGLFLRPLDMAKLGQLVLNKGVLAGREVVPPAWIAESLTARRKTGGEAFGHFWQRDSWNSLSVAMSLGLGGQGIIVLPERDIVIVTTGSIDPQSTPQDLESQTRKITDFVRRDVVPPLVGEGQDETGRKGDRTPQGRR